MADGDWKGVYPYVLGHSRQLSLNKFFDPSAPSMRKVDDGVKKKKIMSFLVATNVIASRPADWNATRSCQYLCHDVVMGPILGAILYQYG